MECLSRTSYLHENLIHWGRSEQCENEARGFFQHPATSTARFITFLALQGLSEMLSPAFLCQDPRPIRHRRLVAHMLTMATLEIGHPITEFI